MTGIGGSYVQATQPAKRRLVVAVDGREKGGKCVVGASLVTAADGRQLRVALLQPGTRILGMTPEGHICHVTVTGVACDGIKHVSTLTLTDGRTVTATGEHRFWVEGTGWVQLNQMQEGNSVRVPHEIVTEGKIVPEAELAILLAYLIADGDLSNRMSFSKREPAVLMDFCEAAGMLGFYTAEYGSVQGVKTVGCSGRLGSGGGNGSPITAFRDTYGLYGVAATKQVPEQVFTWTLAGIRLFLNRYLTCDGWVCRQGKTQLQAGYCSASEILARQIAHLLLRFGIHGNIRPRVVKGKTYWAWETRTTGARQIVQKIGFFGEDGKKAQRLVKETRSLRPYREKPVRVKSITPHVLALPVFDIEVDHPSHAFIVNDMWAHNTHFALTAPGPIAYQNWDIGDEGVVEKFQTTKLVYKAEYGIAVEAGDTQDSIMAKALPEWGRCVSDYHLAMQRVEEGAVRTIVKDTSSEEWEALRLARFGKLTQVMPHHYTAVNKEYRNLIREIYETSGNMVLLHKLKAEWKDNPATGKGNKTGAWERAGYADTGFLVQVNVLCWREEVEGDKSGFPTGPFHVTVRDCRQNPAIAGLDLYGDMASFPWLAVHVYPDSSLEDWQ